MIFPDVPRSIASRCHHSWQRQGNNIVIGIKFVKVVLMAVLAVPVIV